LSWALAVSAAAAAAAAGVGEAAAASVALTVSGVKPGPGEIIARLYAGPDGFPSAPAKAAAQARAPAAQANVTLELSGVTPGRYALIVIHDADGDGVMKKSFLGLPEEGYGLSNNPEPLLVPRFRDGVFAVTDGANAIEVRLVYY
jgi:uncharacterized protein (DUF2141 family)